LTTKLKAELLIAVGYFTNLSKRIAATIKLKRGIPTPLHKEDRTVLEQVILPYFSAHKQYQRILFVGCDYYTWHYKGLFSSKEYWTIEPLKERAKFGADRHIIGLMSEMDCYFQKETIDLIVVCYKCN
jgi:hypothetical protein